MSGTGLSLSIKTFNLLGPPQSSVEFPEQADVQSVGAAWTLGTWIAESQSGGASLMVDVL